MPAPGTTNGHGPSQEDEPGQDWSRALWEALKHRPGRNLVLALTIAVFAAALGATIILREPGKYSSTATLLINDPQQLATAGDDGMINKLNALRLKYAGLAATSTIAGPVAEQLGIDEKTVATDTVALPGPDSLILSAQATTSSPSMAQRMAQGVADELITYVNSENSRFNLPPNLQYSFSVVNPATAATQIAPSQTRAATVGGAMAAVALIAAYVTLQLVAPRRSRE
jgi:capsular polysaccharide biosynthesis protein